MGQGSSPSLPLQAGPPGSTTAQPHLQETKQVTRVQSTQPVLGEGNQPRTFESTTDESGREVVVVVHEADVPRGEAHSQQWFLAVH